MEALFLKGKNLIFYVLFEWISDIKTLHRTPKVYVKPVHAVVSGGPLAEILKT
jgi:hypothetical protein